MPTYWTLGPNTSSNSFICVYFVMLSAPHTTEDNFNHPSKHREKYKLSYTQNNRTDRGQVTLQPFKPRAKIPHTST